MVKTTRLPYTVHKRTHGVWTWYYRRGNEWVKLPGDPGKDPEASALYWKARSGKARPDRSTSIAALITSYQKSPRWTEKAQRTQADYQKVLAYIAAKAGDVSALTFERQHIIEAQQANAQRYRFANYIVQVFSILFEHAIDLGWRRDNPAKGIRLLKGGEGYQPWPAWAVENFRREASGPVLTAFELARGTGQRIGDVLRMRWDDIEGDEIHVVQGKTGAELWIPFTDHLRDYLATLPRGIGTHIVGGSGKPMSYRAIEARLRAPRERAGAQAFSFHGLRYNAASELYEMGCSDAQVQAITGHKTAAMARKYGKGANQRRLARQARGRGKT